MNTFTVLVFILLTLFILVSFILDQIRKWRTRNVFSNISKNRTLETLPVKVSYGFSRSSKLGAGGSGSLFFNAEIFFDNDLIIIAPKSKSIISGAIAKFLPIVYTYNCDLLQMEIDSKYLYKPNYIKLSNWDSLTIKSYFSSSFSKEYLSFQIKPKHKKDSTNFRKIGELKFYKKIVNNLAL